MKFTTIFASALLAASQISSVTATPVATPEEARIAEKRAYFSGLSSKAIKKHRDLTSAAVAEEAEIKKRGLDWNPERHWGDGEMGWHRWSLWVSCGSSPRRRYYYGYLVRLLSYPKPGSSTQRINMVFPNTTSYSGPDQVLPSGVKECHKFGSPVYNPGEQCVDKIKLSNGQYAPRSSGNANTGWYTGSQAEFAGRTVRDIWDCLLNRTAVEFRYVHSDVGYKLVKYELSGERYYRFYDDNNFGWFAYCPAGGASKLKQRQSNGRNNYNPIWDFQPPREQNPLTDQTDIHDFDIPSFNEDTRYSIYFFPPQWNHFVTIDGFTCGHIAVSRPGLRHWTVRLYYGDDAGYVKKELEYVPTPAEYMPGGNY